MIATIVILTTACAACLALWYGFQGVFSDPTNAAAITALTTLFRSEYLLYWALIVASVLWLARVCELAFWYVYAFIESFFISPFSYSCENYYYQPKEAHGGHSLFSNLGATYSEYSKCAIMEYDCGECKKARRQPK